MATILKSKSFWIILTVIIILVSLINFSVEDAVWLTKIKDLFIKLFKPLHESFYVFNQKLKTTVETILNYDDMRDENKRLRERVSRLETQLIRLKEIQYENERLREILNFKERNTKYSLEGARVIGRNPTTWFEEILIDKGKKDGLVLNMAVVTAKGLVGHITDVGDHWAKVQLIIDPNSAVSGMIQRTRDNGVIKGVFEPENRGLCRMVYLSPEANIVPGDLVISSGLGGIFPKGLIIGEIIKVSKDENQLLKNSLLKPSVDFERLEEVFVIKKISPLEEDIF